MTGRKHYPVRSIAGVLCGVLLAAGIIAAQQKKAGAPSVTTAKRIPAAEVRKNFDHEWVRKALVNELLDYWVKYSVEPNGFIQENLDRQWKGWGTQREASLNGQGRVLFTLAVGYEVSGGDKKYLDAINKAADFLMKMHDDQYGGYYNRVTPDLKVIDDSKGGYQSFAIYSLAAAGRVTKNPKYVKAAMDCYHELKAKMSDGPFISGNFNRDFSGPAARGGGGGGRQGAPGGGPGGPGGAPGGGPGRAPQGAPAGTAQANAPQAGRGAAPGGRGAGGHSLNVHMFEALLGLYEATHSPEVWATITAEMDQMAKSYDYEKGYLSESYDADWKPPANANPTGNTGHLFEWASLLSWAVELGADPKFIELGSRNMDLGLKGGYDQEIGGLGSHGRDGTPSYMLWWPQCEVIKATSRYAVMHGRSELWPTFHKTLDFVKKTYFDTEFGGWFEGFTIGKTRDQLGARAYIKGAVDGPELSPYHMTSMYYDLWRISDPKGSKRLVAAAK
jgi:cellobiose epimerase